MVGLLSRATVAAVGLTCKAFLNFGFCSITVRGLPTLMDALESDRRNKGQGVVTGIDGSMVSEKLISLSLDDPLTWGALPIRCFFDSRMTRWALGASDIMFTNPVFSTFFRLGQTIETFRGQGVHQRAVDVAIAKLNQGDWIHLYGEGMVNQPATYLKLGNGIAYLPRFKWGVGRILMEASVPPVVIPMWLTGFDELMPEGRAFPYKYVPRRGAQLSVTFGSPLSADDIKKAPGVIGIDEPSTLPLILKEQGEMPGWTVRQMESIFDSTVLTGQNGLQTLNTTEVAKVREEVTAVIQRRVESLGRSVSGQALSDRL